METFKTPIRLLIEIDSLHKCDELKKFGVIEHVDEMMNVVFLVTCILKVEEMQKLDFVQRIEVERELTLCA